MIEKELHPQKESLLYHSSWLLLVRPLTFTATLSPVIAGTALAKLNGYSIRYNLFISVLIVGFLVQCAVNMFNDYYDYQKGQDHEKWFFSNKLINGVAPSYHFIPVAAGILFALAIIIGGWVGFVSHTLWILVFGGVGVICGYKYSAGPRSLSSLGLAEIIAFIFLGVFPAFVGYFVQSHTIDVSIIALALPYSLVSSTMLLTNNIRDIQKDQNIRRTVAMRLGRSRAVHALTLILAFVYLSVFFLIFLKIVSPISIVTILALPAAIKLRWLLRSKATRADEMKAMKWSAIHHWIFGLIFALSIWITSFLAL